MHETDASILLLVTDDDEIGGAGFAREQSVGKSDPDRHSARPLSSRTAA